MTIVKVKLSILALFKQDDKLGYRSSLKTIEIDLEEDEDASNRIGIHLAAFLEREIDHKDNRTDRELVSLSHSIILVPA